MVENQPKVNKNLRQEKRKIYLVQFSLSSMFLITQNHQLFIHNLSHHKSHNKRQFHRLSLHIKASLRISSEFPPQLPLNDIEIKFYGKTNTSRKFKFHSSPPSLSD